MRVGTLEVRMSLLGVNSLKEKRQILRSLKDRIRHHFNAAVAETDHQDVWRTASLGVVTVANDGQFVNSVLSKIVDVIRRQRGVTVLDYDLEVF
ncbi:MAG: DUF503 domain-containing protein [Planctomycetota bacterium]